MKKLQLVVVVAVFSSLNAVALTELTTGTTTIDSTPPETEAYGINGGDLTITGSGTVVTQNIPSENTMGGVSFGNYWPWIKGVVTVENGAALESDTQLFRGSGVANTSQNNLTRKLVVQSGASAVFSPANGEAYIVGLENGGQQNAWVVVTGAGSTLSLPANVYLGNKGDYYAHSGKMEILDGGHVEGGTFYIGYHTGGMSLTVDGGSMKWTSGIYGFKSGSRWTAATILFKDCVIETPFYKMAYPHGNGGSTVTFNGAVFKPIGTSATNFIDASPTGDAKCPHYVTGNGLIVDAPADTTLNVPAMLQGAGGFTKRGEGTTTLSAANTYTGTTAVEAGTLNVTGALCGGLSVALGATCAVTLAAAPSVGAVSIGGSATFNTTLTATSLSLPIGGRLTVTGIGSDMGSVSDYAGDFVVSGVAEWPKNTAIVSSSTVGFLEKVAASLNASEKVEAGYEFAVVNDASVQLVVAGLVNGTMTWTGGAGDGLWSTAGNWTGADRAIASGDSLVVAAGGASVADHGEEVVLVSAQFDEGISTHVVSAAGNGDELKINAFVTNLSANTQTFNLPVSIGDANFSVHTCGDVTFAGGLAAAMNIIPVVTKTGAGALVVDGATWGGGLDVQDGAVTLTGQTVGTAILSSVSGDIRIDGLFDAGGAAVTLAESSPRILGDNAVLANGLFTYVPRAGYNYLDLGESQTLTLTNGATLTTTAGIFENGTGSGRGIYVCDGSTLAFNNGNNAYVSSKDNGTECFIRVSGCSTLRLPGGLTYLSAINNPARFSRIEVADGSLVTGGGIVTGRRAGAYYVTITNSVVDFTQGFYQDIDSNIDYSSSHVFVQDSVVTSALWRVGNSAGKVHGSTELVFDNATLVPSKDDTSANPYFYCTKPTCNQIKIQDGGLTVDSDYDVTINAPFVGTGVLKKLGAGTVTLASTNTYAGATVVSNGTLRLTGRVVGAIEVASGATLALPIPEDQEALPSVPSLTVDDGGSLAAVSTALPENVRFVKMLEVSSPVSLPTHSVDAAGHVFFVKHVASGCILCYGKKPGLQILVK